MVRKKHGKPVLLLRYGHRNIFFWQSNINHQSLYLAHQSSEELYIAATVHNSQQILGKPNHQQPTVEHVGKTLRYRGRPVKLSGPKVRREQTAWSHTTLGPFGFRGNRLA